MNYIEFDFDLEKTEQSETLVALLTEQGFEGFEELPGQLLGYIRETDFDELAFNGVLDRFDTISYSKTIVENINWNKKWEENFLPVVLVDFVAIRAGFHQPIKNVLHEIIITPKMSFGTGHHPTTYLMISQMKELNFSQRSVVDFGTGTGVLAILACKLGAKDVLAIDHDEWSITNTRENIGTNNCDCIRVQQATTVPGNERFDLVLANINLNVIIDNLPALVSCCNAGAKLLFSGILKENEGALVSGVEQAGLKYLCTAQRGDWIVVSAGK